MLGEEARERARASGESWRLALRPRARVLAAPFYHRPTLDVARELLGKLLVHRAPEGVAAGLIVEVEAYIGESDPACHAAPGPTMRNAPLYGPPGFAYVYLNYGMHVLVNAVTESEGFPAAVLIRALEPVLGLELMRTRRAARTSRRESSGRAPRPGSTARTPRLAPDRELCRGPGRLSAALGLTLSLNRACLSGPVLAIADVGVAPAEFTWTTRVGISVGQDHPWRAHVAPSAYVSTWKAGARARRARALTRRGGA